MRIASRTKQFYFALIVVLVATSFAQARNRLVCTEPNPASMCTPEVTCGSATAPCTVDITRAGSSANVRPGIPNARNNQPFCIKQGTTVVWMTSNRGTGFMISFGDESPFDPEGPIIGGANRQITVKAATPGCFRYDAGAFFSGATFGMSGGSNPELIIIP